MTESPDYANQDGRHGAAGDKTMKTTTRLNKRLAAKRERIARLSALIAQGRR